MSAHAVDGLLIVDKPEGPTSHDIVARIRRLFRMSRVGHTGTLDPMATGVLPLVLGKATRLSRFLTQDRKRYQAVIRLGQATDTYDRSGQPVGPATAPHVRREMLEAALERFRGSIDQTPPVYSAKKIAGEAAYKLARRGKAVTPASVKVHVARLDLLDARLDHPQSPTDLLDAGNHHPQLRPDPREADPTGAPNQITLDITCSAGFYVRSLAHDLGVALGCGAHLESLRRTESGEWTLDQAVPMDLCERDPEAVQARILPMNSLLTWMPSVKLTPEGVTRVQHGRPIRPQDQNHEVAPGPALFRLLAPDGTLLAVATPAADGFLHPALVLV